MKTHRLVCVLGVMASLATAGSAAGQPPGASRSLQLNRAMAAAHIERAPLGRARTLLAKTDARYRSVSVVDAQYYQVEGELRLANGRVLPIHNERWRENVVEAWKSFGGDDKWTVSTNHAGDQIRLLIGFQVGDVSYVHDWITVRSGSRISVPMSNGAVLNLAVVLRPQTAEELVDSRIFAQDHARFEEARENGVELHEWTRRRVPAFPPIRAYMR